jgi:hypothetical protein
MAFPPTQVTPEFHARLNDLSGRQRRKGKCIICGTSKYFTQRSRRSSDAKGCRTMSSPTIHNVAFRRVLRIPLPKHLLFVFVESIASFDFFFASLREIRRVAAPLRSPRETFTRLHETAWSRQMKSVLFARQYERIKVLQ